MITYKYYERHLGRQGIYMCGEYNFDKKLCYLKMNSAVVFKCYKNIFNSIVSLFQDEQELHEEDTDTSPHILRFPENLL